MSDMDVQSLEFAQLVSSLVLALQVLAMLSSLCFGMVMCVLCPHMLEVCSLLFDSDFYR